MAETPEEPKGKPPSEQKGPPETPFRGDHPIFWGELDFRPMVDGDPPPEY